MENNNWNSFVDKMYNHKICINKVKETGICDNHSQRIFCEKVDKYHRFLQQNFDAIKDFYNFAKLNLGQGRHTRNPWISFKGFEDSAIYPCIIFSEDKKPFLTIQVENRDPLNDKKDKNHSIEVIKKVVSWVKEIDYFGFEKITSTLSVNYIEEGFPISNSLGDKYNKSDIMSFECEENLINDFYDLVSKKINIKNTVYKIITNIDVHDEDMNTVFFESSELSSKFRKFVDRIIDDFKEIVIILFTKNSDNKSWMQLPLYTISEKPEKDIETENKYVYKSELHSTKIPNVLNNIVKKINSTKIELINNAEKLKKLSRQDLLKKIDEYQKDYNKGTTTRKVTTYRRRQGVKALSILFSEGYCQLCAKYAPFSNKNATQPFLESDHIDDLSKGGLDNITNTIALCPNCHRKKTYWDDKNEVKKIIKKLKHRNKELIEKWKNK